MTPTAPAALRCKKCRATLGTLCPRGQSLRAGGVLLRQRSHLTCAGCGFRQSFRPATGSPHARAEKSARMTT